MSYPLLLILMSITSAIEAKNIPFSKLNDAEMKVFEQRIAFFYGTTDEDAVALHYLQALDLIDTRGCDNAKEEIIQALQKAYGEVARQTLLSFDTRKAASLELEIILAHTEQATFEKNCQLMEQLYAEIFSDTSPRIKKAAELRAFLYQYKVDAQQTGEGITATDRQVMITLADASEELLLIK